MLGLLRLRKKNLSQGVHDAGRIRAEVRGELPSIQFTGLAVFFVQNFFASTSEGSWRRDVDQLFELLGRRLRFGEIEDVSEPVRAVANLDRWGVRIGLGGAFDSFRLDRDETSASKGSGKIVGSKGSLDLFHEAGFGGAGLGHVDSMFAEK